MHVCVGACMCWVVKVRCMCNMVVNMREKHTHQHSMSQRVSVLQTLAGGATWNPPITQNLCHEGVCKILCERQALYSALTSITHIHTQTGTHTRTHTHIHIHPFTSPHTHTHTATTHLHRHHHNATNQRCITQPLHSREGPIGPRREPLLPPHKAPVHRPCNDGEDSEVGCRL